MSRLLVILFLFTGAASFAQKDSLNNPSFWERTYFGGNVGLQFGTITFIEFSPLMGYRFTEKITAGAGVRYIYVRDNQYKVETSIYGGSLFGRYYFTRFIFAHAEYEILNVPDFSNERRVEYHSPFVGGGYSQPLGARSSMFIMALVNLNNSPYSPYSNPVIRMGITFGV